MATVITVIARHGTGRVEMDRDDVSGNILGLRCVATTKPISLSVRGTVSTLAFLVSALANSTNAIAINAALVLNPDVLNLAWETHSP